MNEFIQMGTDWGLLFIRLGVGIVFLIHGFPKISNRWGDIKGSHKSLTESIRRLGFPFPYQFALSVGILEFFGGMMLIVGFGTRWAALGILPIMLVASGRNIIQKGFLDSGDFPFSLLTTLLGLILLGGGSISLDALLF